MADKPVLSSSDKFAVQMTRHLLKEADDMNLATAPAHLLLITMYRLKYGLSNVLDILTKMTEVEWRDDDRR